LWAASEALKTGGKPGKKAPKSGPFSLPFAPLFGMVFDLSLGVLRGAPKHKPDIRKNQRFRAFYGTGERISQLGGGRMKINVERGALLKALNHVQSVVER